jgi:hypothetical protein
MMAHGIGAHVWDSNGYQYLEGLAGLWWTSLGYGSAQDHGRGAGLGYNRNVRLLPGTTLTCTRCVASSRWRSIASGWRLS